MPLPLPPAHPHLGTRLECLSLGFLTHILRERERKRKKEGRELIFVTAYEFLLLWIVHFALYLKSQQQTPGHLYFLWYYILKVLKYSILHWCRWLYVFFVCEEYKTCIWTLFVRVFMSICSSCIFWKDTFLHCNVSSPLLNISWLFLCMLCSIPLVYLFILAPAQIVLVTKALK